MIYVIQPFQSKINFGQFTSLWVRKFRETLIVFVINAQHLTNLRNTIRLAQQCNRLESETYRETRPCKLNLFYSQWSWKSISSLSFRLICVPCCTHTGIEYTQSSPLCACVTDLTYVTGAWEVQSDNRWGVYWVREGRTDPILTHDVPNSTEPLIRSFSVTHYSALLGTDGICH